MTMKDDILMIIVFWLAFTVVHTGYWLGGLL